MIKNEKGKVLARKVELADSIWKKTKGLMFRGSLPKGSGLLMDFGSEQRPGIWMFCMRFPIDLVYIDSSNRVVDIKEDFRPMTLNPLTWKVHYPKKPARYVLELPAGAARLTGTKLNSKLMF